MFRRCRQVWTMWTAVAMSPPPLLPPSPCSARLVLVSASQAYQRARKEGDAEGKQEELPSWRETLKLLSAQAVQLASETGAFDDLR